MNNSSFKIPYGERNGELLHISQVERGLACDCQCPVCNDQLVARMGSIKKHHFAHFRNVECNGETYLHILGKRLIYNRISTAIFNGQPLPITWDCQQCYSIHEVNLVRKAYSVKLEMNFGVCRPDIALLNKEVQPIAFIEVVVKHSPDKNVFTYVTENNIGLIEFHFKPGDDLEYINNSPTLKPTRINQCPHPKCKICGSRKQKKVLHIVEDKCWKCKAPMNIAILNINGYLKGPKTFTKQEIDLSTKHGVILRQNYSHTLSEKYLSNTCGQCKAFIGGFHMHEYADLMIAENGYHTGYKCMACNGNNNGKHSKQTDIINDQLDDSTENEVYRMQCETYKSDNLTKNTKRRACK